MRAAVLTCALLICAWTASHAQAPTAEWNQSGVESLTQALGYIYRLYVDNGPGLVLTNAVCSETAPTVACSALVPTSATVEGASSQLTATDPVTQLESAKSAPFVYHAPVPPPPPPSVCVYEGATYQTGQQLILTTNKRRVGTVTKDLIAAGFRIDSSVLTKGKYRVTATCIG